MCSGKDYQESINFLLGIFALLIINNYLESCLRMYTFLNDMNPSSPIPEDDKIVF